MKNFVQGGEKMNRHFYFSLVVIASVLFTAGFSQAAATAPATNPSVSSNPSSPEAAVFPYSAEITGDSVKVRSGSGTNYYECGELFTGDIVEVVGSQFVWSKIVPPTGSFSWIPSQSVKPDPQDSTVGIVQEDARVWAGSNSKSPSLSTSRQATLKKGDKVKLLGEQRDEYYKIAPPADAYLWVSTSYTKPYTPKVVVDTPITVAAVQDTQVTPAAATPVAETSSPSTPASSPNDVNAAAPAKSTQLMITEKYNSLKEQIEAERAKSLDQQNYTQIKAGLDAIINDKEAGKTARYAQAVKDQVSGFELAVNVRNQVKEQNQQTLQNQERIEKARTTQLAEIKDLGKYAVIGRLVDFKTLGSGYYRILDESAKTICIISPSQQAVEKDYSSLINKKVGVVGTIEPNNRMASASIRFTQIVAME
jgi:hypothetical protein